MFYLNLTCRINFPSSEGQDEISRSCFFPVGCHYVFKFPSCVFKGKFSKFVATDPG